MIYIQIIHCKKHAKGTEINKPRKRMKIVRWRENDDIAAMCGIATVSFDTQAAVSRRIHLENFCHFKKPGVHLETVR
jgi:hypothetical protein